MGAQSKEDRMPAAVWVVGGIVVLVGLLLAIDWFAAGRSIGRRRFVSAKSQNSDNAGVGYADIQNQLHGHEMQGRDGSI
jgi:hypothetical protein